MAREFVGELNYINPKFLVTESKGNKTESFFLGLGVVFNDFKGLVEFEKMLMEYYRKPGDEETTSHAGNYGGIRVQIQKLIASTINEFFEFLKENTEVFLTSEFKEVLERIPKSDQQLWNGIIAATQGKLKDVTGFLKTIVQVRNNVAFHYDHSGKILRKGYISRFFGKMEDSKNKWAYYSVGNTNEVTRFFFSDAAVEEALYIAAGKKPRENSIGDVSLEKYQNLVGETVQVIGTVTSSLLKQYIQLRRNRPH